MQPIARHLRPVFCLGALLVAAAQIAPSLPAAQLPPGAAAPAPVGSTLRDADIERFLREAKIVRTRGTKKGITNTIRATLSDGVLTHDAHIQVIDEFKHEFRTAMTVEIDFRDSWMFNVAAYRLDRLIQLNMVPVSIAGRFEAKPAAITWWVDDVMMDEGDRLKKKAQSPEPQSWSRQMQMVRLFDQLIYNTDRNVGNLLIGTDWRIWAIDHTRAFRKFTSLKTPASIARCDRVVFERLKALDREALKREVGQFLDDSQIKALLARRDAIVAKLESLGPGVLFDGDVRGTMQ